MCHIGLLSVACTPFYIPGSKIINSDIDAACYRVASAAARNARLMIHCFNRSYFITCDRYHIDTKQRYLNIKSLLRILDLTALQILK